MTTFLIIAGGLVLLAFGLWLTAPRDQPGPFVDEEPIPAKRVTITAAKIDCGPDGTTVRPLRPHEREAPALFRVHLTMPEREFILAHFEQSYTDRNVWPDMRLRAFIEAVRTARRDELIPVYYAQRAVVQQFAEQHTMPWLAVMLMPAQAGRVPLSPLDIEQKAKR